MLNKASPIGRESRKGANKKLIMSQRQSCNRCRQQKVRCLRDEAPRGESIPSSSGRPTLSRCERCTKAGVECVYSRMCCVASITIPLRFLFVYYILKGGR